MENIIITDPVSVGLAADIAGREEGLTALTILSRRIGFRYIEGENPAGSMKLDVEHPEEIFIAADTYYLRELLRVRRIKGPVPIEQIRKCRERKEAAMTILQNVRVMEEE